MIDTFTDRGFREPEVLNVHEKGRARAGSSTDDRKKRDDGAETRAEMRDGGVQVRRCEREGRVG